MAEPSVDYRSAAERTLDLTREIQAVPAPTFGELRRSALMASTLKAGGLSNVVIDPMGNVTGTMRGESLEAGTGSKSAGKNHRRLLVTAHLDTVFGPDTDLTLKLERDRIIGPGIGDNALGLAGLAALLWMLEEGDFRPAWDLVLAANVREEGLGNLEGMNAVLDGLTTPPDAVIVLEGMRLGRISYQGVGSRRYRITCTAEGGHSWENFGSPSAIHGLVHLGHLIAGLRVSQAPKTTYNIGVIQGGSSVNSIAREASLLLDLRSEDPVELQRIARQVEEMVDAYGGGAGKGVAAAMPTVSRELIGERPAGGLEPDHPLARAAMAAAEHAGIRDSVCSAASTDANAPLSRGIPAVCIGLSRGKHAHRPDEYILTAPLEQGLQQLLDLVLQAGGG
jgi:tripeptide aminopeptidase